MKAFSNRNHNVTILVIRPEKNKITTSNFKENSIAVYEIHPTSITPFSGRRGFGKYVNYLLCNFPIKKIVSEIVKKNKIDYVYSYMPGIGSSYPAMKIKAKHNVRHVLDYADFHTFVRPKRLVYKSFNNAEKIITITSYLKDHLLQKGISANKIHVIPNGVDLELFDPTKYTGEEKSKLRSSFDAKKLVFFVGALQDLDIIIKSAKIVVEKFDDVKFVIVGDHRDPNRSKEVWENKVRENGLSSNFVFLGRKPKTEIPLYIMCADVCLDSFPDEPYYAAAHPVKLLEYGACGKPVVATKVHETQKLIHHGTHGYLSNPSDYEEYAKYIIKLLDSPELAEKMGIDFQSYVREKFDWDKIAHELENILKV